LHNPTRRLPPDISAGISRISFSEPAEKEKGNLKYEI
jgi:hypothetical protein